MEDEILYVKRSVYAGMSIYNTIKDNKIILEGEELSQEDKKYLSLYLGIVNTNNSFSYLLKEKGYNYDLNISYKILNINKCLGIYINDFAHIFREISFNSINEYLDYLLNKDVVIKINKKNNFTFEEYEKVSNKQLVK